MRVAVRTLVLVTLLAAPALAVCPQPQPKVCAEFFKSFFKSLRPGNRAKNSNRNSPDRGNLPPSLIEDAANS